MGARDLFYLFAGYHYCERHNLWTKFECRDTE